MCAPSSSCCGRPARDHSVGGSMNGDRSPTSADMALARRLASQEAGEWGPTAIARVLSVDGVKVSRHAVARWIDPDKAARHRAQTRLWNSARRVEDPNRLRMPNGHRRTRQWKVARMRL